ncbi:hypothetical protein V6000_001282 [Aspergillus fumigatus]
MNQSLLAPHRILKSRRRGYVSIIAFVDTTTTTRYIIAISISNIVLLIRIRVLTHRLIFTFPASTLLSRNSCSILIFWISCPTVHLLATVDLAVTGSLRWQVDHTSHRLRKGIVLGWTPPAVLEHLMA